MQEINNACTRALKWIGNGSLFMLCTCCLHYAYISGELSIFCEKRVIMGRDRLPLRRQGDAILPCGTWSLRSTPVSLQVSSLLGDMRCKACIDPIPW